MVWIPLITLALAIANFLIGLFPDASMGIVTSIRDTQNQVRTMTLALNYLMPVTTFFLVFGVIVITEIALFLWHASRWFITMVTGGIVKAK